MHALGRRAHPSEGPQIGAAVRHRGRARLLAGRGGRAPWSPQPRRGRGRAASWSRSTTRNCRRSSITETALDAQDAGDPSRRSATISASSASSMPARSTRPSPMPTRWSRRPSCSAATPASPSSRARSSPTGMPREQRLTVYQGTQAPHMMQNLFAKHLGIAEQPGARDLTKDVGGSFGIKVHTYADEMATVALSKLLQAAGEVRRRPHRELRHRHPCPRPPRQGARSASPSDGTITAFEIDDLTGIGPYSVYPRTSGHRGQPGRQPHRRPLHLPELSRAGARGVHQQECHVPVPRGRPSDRGGGDRRPGRARGGQDRHGPAGNPPAQPDRRRRLSDAVGRRA